MRLHGSGAVLALGYAPGAPGSSPLPSAVNPSDGATWLSVLQTLGLERWPLALGYAAAALPDGGDGPDVRPATGRRPSADAFALGIRLGVLRLSPTSLGYDFAILLFPMMTFPAGAVRTGSVPWRLLLAVMLQLLQPALRLDPGGATRIALVSLFWLPAGLAIWGIGRELGARQRLRLDLKQAGTAGQLSMPRPHFARERSVPEPNRHADRKEAAMGHSRMRPDHAQGLDPGSPCLRPKRTPRTGESRNAEQVHAWAEEFQVPKAYASYQEVLDDPEVDAVYIPLPNELHKIWVNAAADSGKHILCEKPLALNVAEARAMVAHCRARGVLLMEAFMWRHQPRTAALRRLVAEGAIGELRLIRSLFSFTIDPGDWRLDPARGGGALWDVGCYGVSTARLFAGAEPEGLLKPWRTVPGSTGVDLSLTAVLRFPGGILGQLDCSFEQPFRCFYELIGTRGVIEVPDAYLPPARPTAHLRGDSGAQDFVFDGHNQYAEMVDAFSLAAADAEHRLPDPAEDGLAQMTVLDTILQASREC